MYLQVDITNVSLDYPSYIEMDHCLGYQKTVYHKIVSI